MGGINHAHVCDYCNGPKMASMPACPRCARKALDDNDKIKAELEALKEWRDRILKGSDSATILPVSISVDPEDHNLCGGGCQFLSDPSYPGGLAACTLEPGMLVILETKQDKPVRKPSCKRRSIFKEPTP